MNSLVSSNLLLNDKIRFQTFSDYLQRFVTQVSSRRLGPRFLRSPWRKCPLGGQYSSWELLTGVWVQAHWTFISEETGRWNKALTPTLCVISQVQQAAPLLELYIR